MITVDIEAALHQIGVLGSSLPGLLSRDQAGPAVVSEYARLNREFFDSGGRTVISRTRDLERLQAVEPVRVTEILRQGRRELAVTRLGAVRPAGG